MAQDAHPLRHDCGSDNTHSSKRAVLVTIQTWCHTQELGATLLLHPAPCSKHSAILTPQTAQGLKTETQNKKGKCMSDAFRAQKCVQGRTIAFCAMSHQAATYDKY